MSCTVLAGNVDFNKTYQQAKKEVLTKVHQGLPPLQAYTMKLTKKLVKNPYTPLPYA
jgi:hypothetical protein